MSANGLVRIKKHGEPSLRVHETAVAQHLKLGWQHDPESEEELLEAATQPGQTEEKADDKKSPKK